MHARYEPVCSHICILSMLLDVQGVTRQEGCPDGRRLAGICSSLWTGDPCVVSGVIPSSYRALIGSMRESEPD